jgi:hypothetical protein
MDPRTWMRVAASAGIPPDRFWRLTPREIVVAVEGRARSLRDEWDIARHHAAWIVNAIRGFAAGFGGGEATWAEPQDFVKFPDEEPKRSATSAGDYDKQMKALKMAEEARVYWDAESGAVVRAEVLDERPKKPRAVPRGRSRATVKR